MTGIAAKPALTICARVHPSGVGQVPCIYASILSDIFAETLQNACRAGA